MKKREAGIAGAVALVLLLLAVFLSNFIAIHQAALYLMPMTDPAEDTWSCPGTVYLERSVPQAWFRLGYTRVRMDTGRWHSAFLDGTLVYINRPQTGTGLPVIFPDGGTADLNSLPGFSLVHLIYRRAGR